jgi:hypothetical protein
VFLFECRHLAELLWLVGAVYIKGRPGVNVISSGTKVMDVGSGMDPSKVQQKIKKGQQSLGKLMKKSQRVIIERGS